MSLSSLLNSFRGVSEQPTPAATPQQSTNPAVPVQNIPGANPTPQQTQQSAATAGNGVVPAGSEQTPFAGFEKLWENESPANGTPIPAKKGVFGEINPEAFAEAAKGIDFSQIVTPEIKSRMAAGGEDAVKASMEAMNSMLQANYANSAQVSTKLIEKGIENFQKDFMKNLPSIIKKHNTSNSLRQENPIFANPAAAPVLEMIQSRLQQKFPKASEAELAQMAKKYITDLASPMTTKTSEDENSSTAKGDNWESYFGLGEPN